MNRAATFGITLLIMGWILPVQAQQGPTEVTFPSGALQLHGFLWKPDGPGPFPAILWNHGSEKLPGSRPELAAFYTAHQFIFFVPHRRGQGRSPGPYVMEEISRGAGAGARQRVVQMLDAQVDDVAAALAYLKSQPFVDSTRIAVSGCSYGGIETLLTGAREAGIRALVPFAPGAMSWAVNDAIQHRLEKAVLEAKAPILLIQAENDFSLGPSQVLSQQAVNGHVDMQSRVYPAFGDSHADGHYGFCTRGMDVWGNDVLAFLQARMDIHP